MPMTTTAAFPKGEQPLHRDAALKKGEMQAPAGTVTDAVCVRFLADVQATGASAAFTVAERLAVLSGFRVSLTQELPGGIKLQPWQSETLDKVRDDALRWLKLDVDGFADDASGLAQPFEDGVQAVNFTAYIPTGHTPNIAESTRITGLGVEQLLDCEFILTRVGDPFKAVRPTLKLTNLKVIMSPGVKKAEARRIGLPVYARRVVNANGYEIRTEPGLVLCLEDMAPHEANLLSALRVTAGGVKVTDDPNGKAEILADLLRDYESGGRPMDPREESINARRTVVFAQPPNALTRMYSGHVEARQVTRNKEWEGRALYFPLLSHAETMALVQAYAQHIPDGRVVHAVCTGMYEGLECDDKSLPYTGMTLFLDNESDFPSYPGLRCSKGGVPYVYIPEHRLRAAALKVISVMARTTAHPGGDTRMARAIVLDEARWIPGAVTSERGFDEMSAVRQEVAERIRAKVAEHDSGAAPAVM
ncbi:hypothetical protein MYSTI_04157 [Myxococcus stipitatus DSM 14675]|uniref:Uncharacterized protein n=1 Tax=Myxococcus stipitatus (strain DSM 14675 / JCM 12634 / Mx s8) TaxID=1278073 RepID=L7UD05_MYXSD|nr:hypothetical protein [Myxococcus stipitatus]AGC45457.1 hypothetical protein MYSTI_04157 [Myxococcus stipitatus DSM 14675]